MVIPEALRRSLRVAVLIASLPAAALALALRSRGARLRPASPASCSSPASVLIPNRGRLTSAHAGAANGRSSGNFLAQRSSVQAS
jgi:hypothetical protein